MSSGGQPGLGCLKLAVKVAREDVVAAKGDSKWESWKTDTCRKRTLGLISRPRSQIKLGFTLRGSSGFPRLRTSLPTQYSTRWAHRHRQSQNGRSDRRTLA